MHAGTTILLLLISLLIEAFFKPGTFSKLKGDMSPQMDAPAGLVPFGLPPLLNFPAVALIVSMYACGLLMIWVVYALLSTQGYNATEHACACTLLHSAYWHMLSSKSV